MKTEINLMKNYPKTKRDPFLRLQEKTEQHKKLAKSFGKDFFDGTRETGYGGFTYNSRFWEPVVPNFVEHFDIKDGDSILDVGCAKGFMLYDFLRYNPNFNVKGIDISKYAIENAHKSVKKFLEVGDCRKLPFEDNSFDFCFSITTIHNVEPEECLEALKEIELFKICFTRCFMKRFGFFRFVRPFIHYSEINRKSNFRGVIFCSTVN